jgi:PAS domain S-box-containing protein
MLSEFQDKLKVQQLRNLRYLTVFVAVVVTLLGFLFEWLYHDGWILLTGLVVSLSMTMNYLLSYYISFFRNKFSLITDVSIFLLHFWAVYVAYQRDFEFVVMLPVGISIFTFSLIFDRFSKSLVFIFTITTFMLVLMLIKRGWEAQYTVAIITLYSGAFISNQIQQRKREFHQELEKQESRYASLVENMNDGLIYADEQWKIIQVSEQFCRISGYSRADLIGTDLRKLTAGNEALANASQFFRMLESGGSPQAEFQIIRKGEGVNAFRVNGAPYFDTTGQRSGSMVVYTDITSLKQTQDLLKKREEGYRTFIDQSSIGIWRADYLQPIPAGLPIDEQIDLLLNTGVITECNDFMAQMYGYRHSSELIGRPVRDFYSSENNQDETKTRELLGQFVRSGYRISNSESKERDRTGNVRYMLNNNIGIVERGNLIRTWGVQADITERKNTERELQEAYKELDTFFYKASHDLKGPLASMMGVVYLGRMENKDPNVNRYFDMIETSVQRLDATLMDLIRLARTRKGASKLHAIGLAELVQQTMDVISHLPKFAKTKFEFQIPEYLEVHTDKVLLQSVLQNLMHNAINYSNRHHPQISISARENEDTVELQVSDNGDGIAAEIQPRIFEMFYRGHQDSNGSGLGLFIVKNALEKMHGTIRFKTEKGMGTTFFITFPKQLSES